MARCHLPHLLSWVEGDFSVLPRTDFTALPGQTFEGQLSTLQDALRKPQALQVRLLDASGLAYGSILSGVWRPSCANVHSRVRDNTGILPGG